MCPWILRRKKFIIDAYGGGAVVDERAIRGQLRSDGQVFCHRMEGGSVSIHSCLGTFRFLLFTPLDMKMTRVVFLFFILCFTVLVCFCFVI